MKTAAMAHNPERFEGIVKFLACEAHTVQRGVRMADATTTVGGILMLVPGEKN